MLELYVAFLLQKDLHPLLGLGVVPLLLLLDRVLYAGYLLLVTQKVFL